MTTDATPAWFTASIAEGLQVMVTLSLPGQPPAETIGFTADVWVQAVWAAGSGCWNQDADAPRLRQAFLSLARTADRWPAPKHLVDHMPARPQLPKLPAPPMTPEQRAANSARLKAILAQLTAKMTRPPIETPTEEQMEAKRRQAREILQQLEQQQQRPDDEAAT